MSMKCKVSSGSNEYDAVLLGFVVNPRTEEVHAMVALVGTAYRGAIRQVPYTSVTILDSELSEPITI